MFVPASYFMVTKTLNDHSIFIRMCCPFVHMQDIETLKTLLPALPSSLGLQLN